MLNFIETFLQLFHEDAGDVEVGQGVERRKHTAGIIPDGVQVFDVYSLVVVDLFK